MLRGAGDRRDVAVKILRPGVAESMALDMALLSGAAAFVDGWLPLPWIRCLRLPEIVAQFREHMLAQVRACCCSVCACAVLCTVGCVAVWLLAPPSPPRVLSGSREWFEWLAAERRVRACVAQSCHI